jgi:hypothetical protein
MLLIGNKTYWIIYVLPFVWPLIGVVMNLILLSCVSSRIYKVKEFEGTFRLLVFILNNFFIN